jgi:hypothetical protein
MKRVVAIWIVVVVAVAVSCGFPRLKPLPTDSAGSDSGSDSTCIFDQSTFDQCLVGP